MSLTFYGQMREPLPAPYPANLPRVGEDPVPGTDAAPLIDGVTFDGCRPRCCVRCGSTALDSHFHRDIIDCLLEGGLLRGGPHLHWVCTCCGADFTTPVLPGTHVE
jgi:hypothetical protein